MEILISTAIVANKIAGAGIGLGAIWVLQELITDDRWKAAFPVVDNIVMRFALTLIATGFAIDFFSAYTPTPSEVVMNVGIAVLLLVFYRQFQRCGGDHPLLKRGRKSI